MVARTPTARAFVSYSHSDAAFVDRLAADLDANGISAWVDIKEVELGTSLTKSIEGALLNCDALLLVLSDRSVGSHWVQREWRAVLTIQGGDDAARPRLVPLLIENCEVPPFLRDVKYADFRGGYGEAFKAVAKILGVTSPVVPSVRFGEDLIALLRRVELNFGELVKSQGPVPTHDLFDAWSPIEEELKRLAVIEHTSLRRTLLDRERWALRGYESDAAERAPLDNEPWPRASFFYQASQVAAQVVALGNVHGYRTSLPGSLAELFKMTGAQFSN